MTPGEVITMANAKIVLGLDSTFTPPAIVATAYDPNGNPIPGGTLTTSPNAKIDWSNAANVNQEFVVRFLDRTTSTSTPGWPFVQPGSPADQKLRVGQGAPASTKLKNTANVYWEYKVAMAGYKELDPMIIIRSSSTLTTTLAVALIAGAVAGAAIAFVLLS
jgi:hypothetical protein